MMNRRGFLIAASAPIIAVPASALADLDGVASPFPGVSVCMTPMVAPTVDRAVLLKDYFAFLISELPPVFDELGSLGYPAGSLDVTTRAPRMHARARSAPSPSTRAAAVMLAAGVRL